MQSSEKPGASFIDAVGNSLLALAEIGGNRLLGYDETALAACRELQGHCIAIEITDLEFRVYCHPGNWGIRLSATPPGREVDASVSGRLMALITLASTRDKVSTSIQERVHFHGNIAIAQKLQSILAELDVDWEEALAQHSGDLLAVQIHKRARHLGQWFRQSAESVLQTSSEYLREEVRLSPTLVEFEQFQLQLTRLKQDVARSEARLQRLLEQASRPDA